MHDGIKRHVDGHAPSWSWASIDGPVLLRQHIKGEEEFFIQTVTDDPYGPVQRASLRLRMHAAGFAQASPRTSMMAAQTPLCDSLSGT
jgi:hypothetical protein